MRIFIYISKARTGFTHCFWVLWTTWSAAPGYTSLWLRVPATSWSRLTSTKVHCNPWEKALSNCQNESNCGTFLLNDVVTLSFCSCRSIVHEDSWVEIADKNAPKITQNSALKNGVAIPLVLLRYWAPPWLSKRCCNPNDGSQVPFLSISYLQVLPWD